MTKSSFETISKLFFIWSRYNNVIVKLKHALEEYFLKDMENPGAGKTQNWRNLTQKAPLSVIAPQTQIALYFIVTSTMSVAHSKYSTGSSTPCFNSRSSWTSTLWRIILTPNFLLQRKRVLLFLSITDDMVDRHTRCIVPSYFNHDKLIQHISTTREWFHHNCCMVIIWSHVIVVFAFVLCWHLMSYFSKTTWSLMLALLPLIKHNVVLHFAILKLVHHEEFNPTNE